MALVSVITSSLVWYHSLCLLVLPVDLGGWQSHPAQPDRLLETEQPSSLHWTHKTDQTSQNNTCGQNRHRGTHARTHTWHTATTPRTKREATQPHIHFMDREREWEGKRLFDFSQGQPSTRHIAVCLCLTWTYKP